jgi:hypothetical protein
MARSLPEAAIMLSDHGSQAATRSTEVADWDPRAGAIQERESPLIIYLLFRSNLLRLWTVVQKREQPNGTRVNDLLGVRQVSHLSKYRWSSPSSP